MRQRFWLSAIGGVLCGILLWSGGALAAGNVQIDSVGATTGETTLVLETSAGQAVKPSADSTPSQANYRGLQAGTYSLRTLVSGRQVGQAQRVDVRDNETTRYRVDLSTGVATAVTASLLARTQQQQSMFWLGLYLGHFDTKADGKLTSMFGDGSGSLGSSGWGGGLEFRIAPPMARTQTLGHPFFYGRWNSIDTDNKRRFVQLHPGTGPDSGMSSKFDWMAALGAGWRFPVTPEVGISPFGGLAWTKTSTKVFSNESGGGGPNNVATTTDTSTKGQLGLEVGYRLRMPQGRNTELFLRAERTWYGSSRVNVTSPFTGATYTGSESSGHYNSFGVGALMNF